MLLGLMVGNIVTCSRPWFNPWQGLALMTLPVCRVPAIVAVLTVLLRLTAVMMLECPVGLVMNGAVNDDVLV